MERDTSSRPPFKGFLAEGDRTSFSVRHSWILHLVFQRTSPRVGGSEKEKRGRGFGDKCLCGFKSKKDSFRRGHSNINVHALQPFTKSWVIRTDQVINEVSVLSSNSRIEKSVSGKKGPVCQKQFLQLFCVTGPSFSSAPSRTQGAVMLMQHLFKESFPFSPPCPDIEECPASQPSVFLRLRSRVAVKFQKDPLPEVFLSA